MPLWLLSTPVFSDDLFAPSEEELLLKSGPLAGKIMSPDRRPVLEITPEQRQELGLPDLGPNVLWVANFYEQKSNSPDGKLFHIAAIPLDGIDRGVKEVVDRSKYNPDEDAGVWKKITSLAPHFHAQLSIEFSKDILLFDQEVDSATKKLKEVKPVGAINRMTFSVGAARPGKAFSPHHAINDAYRRVSLFIGEGEAHRDLLGGQSILPYELDIPREKLADFLKLAAKESTELRYTRPYNAMKDGCLSTTLDLLDRVLFKKPPKRFPYAWPNNPEAVMGEFKVRGISYKPLEPITPERSARANKGNYSYDRPHPYTRLSRAAGACASALSRALVRFTKSN